MNFKIIAIPEKLLITFDPKIEFEVIKKILDRIPEVNALDVRCIARPVYRGIQNILPQTVTVIEEEVTGYATGDFIRQCVSAINPNRADLGHNPADDPADITSGATDMIGRSFFIDKAYQNGTLEWNIPTVFKNVDDEEIGRIIIQQKFILENGILTIFKGGQELMKANLNLDQIL